MVAILFLETNQIQTAAYHQPQLNWDKAYFIADYFQSLTYNSYLLILGVLLLKT